MKMQTLPPELHAVVKETCGAGVDLQLISNRRGSAVWKATGPLRAVAVKAGASREGTVITARETAALHAMGCDGRMLAHGRFESTAWMITPWHEGPSMWEALADVRTGRSDLQTARDRVVAVCEAVAQLHKSGWVHSDLQPSHAIHTTQGVVLIDCSWAWHPRKLFPSMMFRGGRPHLLAPELAAAVEAGLRPVAPSQAAEVYALAASLWQAITGHWPLDYAAAGIDPAQMNTSQLRQAIGTGRLAPRAASTWPSVQDVLASVLVQSPEGRPTAAELMSFLRSV